VAVIKSVLRPKSEMKEKKARVEDALHATPCGRLRRRGPRRRCALVRALKAIEKLVGKNEDQTTGIKILARSIEEPAASDRSPMPVKMPGGVLNRSARARARSATTPRRASTAT